MTRPLAEPFRNYHTSHESATNPAHGIIKTSKIRTYDLTRNNTHHIIILIQVQFGIIAQNCKKQTERT